MKRKIYLLASALCLLIACSNGDEEDNRTLINTYIDVSDFTMLKGSPEGAVEVEFNNLKNKDLVSGYLGRVFNARPYTDISIEFNGDRMTYVESGLQTISFYTQKDDTMFIWNADTLRFVVLVDQNNNLYRRQGLVRYPYSEEKDTIRALNEVITLDKVLKLAGYNNVESMTNPEDTLIWCNVIYPFD
ncbi:MAG: hypothetical protein LBV43_12270 [Prevotella sp.]|nr:hypothetical protein [Prevotella sp.]